MIVARGTEYEGVRLDTRFAPVGRAAFLAADYARIVVVPDGRMALPEHRMAYCAAADYSIDHYNFTGRKRYPADLPFPAMSITRLSNAVWLPFGAPVLLTAHEVITDFMPHWALDQIGWFDVRPEPPDEETGVTPIRLLTLKDDLVIHDRLQIVDTALYLDHAYSRHFGHFLADCLSRLYALAQVREMFGDVKLLIAADEGAVAFQNGLLQAAGVPIEAVVRSRAPVICRNMLLVTPAVGLGSYATPTAALLWGAMRDNVIALAGHHGRPDRVYLSRRGNAERPLQNERAVEDIFARFGFDIIRPECLPVTQQIAIAAHASMIAGPSGSNMFHLAFQGRLGSTLILVWSEFMQMAEPLFAAGHDASIWYHLGYRTPGAAGDSWTVNLQHLESDVAAWVGEYGTPSRRHRGSLA